MAFLGVVFGLAFFGGIFWAIGSSFYLLAAVNTLKRQVAALEKHLKAIDPQFEASPGPIQVQSNLRGTATRRTSTPPPAEEASQLPDEAPSPVAAAAKPEKTQHEDVPERFVLTERNQTDLANWLSANWFYVIAAVSLAFAGIFFVRYGIEHGLLSPTMRAICGMALGAALILAGERLRSVGGAGAGTLGMFVPSTLASGGIVSLYSAVLGARVLYDLIGIEVAFLGLAAIGALAIGLGLLHGGFLSIMGIAGAVIAPFVIGGESSNTWWLFYYFALIGCVALWTDAYRRTAWLSAAGLALVYAGAVLVHLSPGSSGLHFLAFAALIAAASVMIPSLSVRPSFQGAMVFNTLHRRGVTDWPEFPTRLAMAGIAGLILIAVFVAGESALSFWLSLAAMFALLLVLTVWLHNGILDDAVPLALAAALAIIGMQGAFDLEVANAYRTAEIGFEESAPKTILWLLAFAAAVPCLAAWKSNRSQQFSVEWAFAAAAFTPATVGLVALWWNPLAQLSDTVWALHVAGLALLMTVLAQNCLKDDDGWRLRPSIFALSALNLIAFAVSIVLTETALTLAFAAVAISASWLDRRYDLKLLSYFVQIGVVVCGYRLLADPGLPWAVEAPFHEVLIAFGGVTLLLFGALRFAMPRERLGAIIVTESSVWSLPGILACIVLYRGLATSGETSTHWALSLFAMIWLISGAAQFHRSRIEGALREVRLLLAALFTGSGAVLLFGALTIGNPLVKDTVIGPPGIDSLLVAYGLPAVLIAWLADLLRPLPRQIGTATAVLASLCAAAYVALEIRRVWQGPDLSAQGVFDGELYTYTVALLLLGAGLLVRSLQRPSTALRRVAMIVIGLAIAKVFLIDIGGLEGLIRVFSFLILGLVLAGLAWLDGMMARQRQG